SFARRGRRCGPVWPPGAPGTHGLTTRRSASSNATPGSCTDCEPRLVSDEPFGIERAEVLEVALPLKEPFVASFGPTASRHVVLVRLVDGRGRVGWGEAAPLDHPFYLPDTVAGAFATIVDHALPLCLRAGTSSGGEAAAAMAPIRGNTF